MAQPEPTNDASIDVAEVEAHLRARLAELEGCLDAPAHG